MDDELLRIIGLFQRSVEQLFGQVTRYFEIQLPVTNTDWIEISLPVPAEVPGGIKCFKHGFGIAMQQNGGVTNFDLGDNGEIDGFTAAWLAGFVNSHQIATSLSDEKIIQSLIDDGVQTGEIVFSGYINYYLSNTR